MKIRNFLSVFSLILVVVKAKPQATSITETTTLASSGNNQTGYVSTGMKHQ